MKKRSVVLVLLCAVLLIAYQGISLAQSEAIFKKSAVYETIRKGYEEQASIRNKNLSMDTMYSKLSPYFVDTFLQVFTDENSGVNKGYLFSKKAPFSFDGKTKIAYDKQYDLLYVYERVKGKYEVITMQKDQGSWEMAGYYKSEKLLPEIQKLQK
ncbi:DUF3993 domain-containing protein [Bacillus sp. 165]|uniref:DUF3993 domain-containing protein n=1 Tax=Bacillus sp. 165 TaxID=1529117 RepID=UPI001ADD5C65|nr:DUF3993 domain-containing protein [Bacillus sp. 165]MBO9130356.1 DUF3993 domain-containing protein [Bacillus sp. 165]